MKWQFHTFKKAVKIQIFWPWLVLGIVKQPIGILQIIFGHNGLEFWSIHKLEEKKILITNISYLSRGFILPAFHDMTFYIFLRKKNQKIKQINGKKLSK